VIIQPSKSGRTYQHDSFSRLRELEEAKKVFLELLFSGKNTGEARILIRNAERAYKEGNTAMASNLAKEALNEMNKTQDNDKSACNENLSLSSEKSEKQYRDGSDDPNVSMKTPTQLNKYQVELEVRAHENQHVRHELFEALNNNEVADIYVRIKYSLDKSGKLYLKGGETVVKKRKAIDYKALTEKLRHTIDIKQK